MWANKNIPVAIKRCWIVLPRQEPVVNFGQKSQVGYHRHGKKKNKTKDGILKKVILSKKKGESFQELKCVVWSILKSLSLCLWDRTFVDDMVVGVRERLEKFSKVGFNVLAFLLLAPSALRKTGQENRGGVTSGARAEMIVQCEEIEVFETCALMVVYLGWEHCAVLSELTSAYTKKKDSGKPVPSKSNKNEMGKVCLRFAPEQSGFLHIGHARAALMNQYLAQKYNGKVIIHSDDTIPAESNEFLMEMAEKLIKEGKAYINDTPSEQMQKERVDRIDSKCRNNTVEENVNLWNEIKAGSQRGLQCYLREKLEMNDPNKSLRDPEYHDRNAQYFEIQEDMGLRKRMEKVDGIGVDAQLSQLCKELGPSKTLNLKEWDKLWNINKKIIDPVCPWYTAIVDEGRVLLTLKDGPEPPFVRMIPKHKKYEGAGEKATTFTKKIWIEQADAKAIAEKNKR
ncbi:glutamate--tRNA ligase, cytoplasmic [Tanacetum coccineum]